MPVDGRWLNRPGRDVEHLAQIKAVDRATLSLRAPRRGASPAVDELDLTALRVCEGPLGRLWLVAESLDALTMSGQIYVAGNAYNDVAEFNWWLGPEAVQIDAPRCRK